MFVAVPSPSGLDPRSNLGFGQSMQWPADIPHLREAWSLDPAVAFLNHGSFGACPNAVLVKQALWQRQMERQPVQFFLRDLPPLLDTAREELARFVSARPDDLAFVPNVTAAVNTVLRSLDLTAGDEIVVTSHTYGACRNAAAYVGERTGARLVTAEVPFPIAAPEVVERAVLAALTPRTRLVLLDHVTSPTGLVFPVASLVRQLAERGVDTLIDGAHAPGMVDVDVQDLGAAYYAGNCHKWLCAPKGAGFLVVRPDRQAGVHPLAISHGYAATRAGRSRFRLEFDWGGTDDPTAALCVPEAIRVMASLLPGGWPAVRQRNHAMALAARELLADALGIAPPAPATMLGSLAALPLPDAPESSALPFHIDPMQDALLARYQIEVPVMPWPKPPQRLLRISAQLYNRQSDYERLGRSLRDAAFR